MSSADIDYVAWIAEKEREAEELRRRARALDGYVREIKALLKAQNSKQRRES